MKVLPVLAVLGTASIAHAETCSGFESRLDSLATQVQAMIDIVENLTPPSGPNCGGIIGGKVTDGTFITAISTADGSGNESKRFDTQWCCNQCISYTGSATCTWWTLQFVTNTQSKCQLYAEKAVADRTQPYYPGAFYFMQKFGVGPGVKTVTGRIPHTGTWGSASSATDRGLGSWMYNSNTGSGAATITEVMPRPTGGAVAEGFELCDTIGSFKVNFVSGAGNGNAVTNWVSNPLECCTLCKRNKQINGAAQPNSCALWSYNYDSKRRQCQFRDNTYVGLTGGVNPQTNLADLATFQNTHAVCAATGTTGNPRFHPNGNACAGSFPASRWSAGFPTNTDLVAISNRA